jgi:hypothetical protein
LKKVMKIILILILSMLLQLTFLPTLCGHSQNVAKFYVAITIDILIPLRLFYGTNETDEKLYLTILLTSFIWIHFFMNVLSYL